MAGNSSFDDIISTTLQNYAPRIQDNIFQQIPTWNWLKQAGNVKILRGGRKIVLPIQEAKNGTAESYSGYGLLSSTPSAEFTAAEYDIRQYTVFISINGLEEFQNQADWQVVDLLDSKTKSAESSLADKLSTDTFAAQSGNNLDGLQSLVSDDGTGTVGGISASTSTYWANKYYGTVGSFAANGITKMRSLLNDCTFGSESPDYIVTTQTVYEYFQARTEAREAYVFVGNGGNKMNVGQEALSFHTRPVLFDRACSSGRMYMLNSKHLWLYMAAGKNFTTTQFLPMTINGQDAKVARIFFYGNLVTDERRKQGVLSGITA